MKELGASDDDIVYLSALDEILNENGFKQGLKRFDDGGKTYLLKQGNNNLKNNDNEEIYERPSFGFNLDMYVYKFNLFCKPIDVAQMTQFSLLKKILPATIRSLSIHTHDAIKNSGWHFTFLDNTDGDRVHDKHRSWAHSRDRLPNQKVKFTHQSKQESLQRMFLDYQTKHVEITKETHPKYLIDNLEKYKNYIF